MKIASPTFFFPVYAGLPIDIRGPPQNIIPHSVQPNEIHLFSRRTPRCACLTLRRVQHGKDVEFKIRVPQADRWEDTPVYRSKTLSGTAEEIAREAQEIAEGIALSQCSDVRWNYEGETQGH